MPNLINITEILDPITFRAVLGFYINRIILARSMPILINITEAIYPKFQESPLQVH